MKKVIIGDCELYLGDCLERMKEIPDGSVDMVLTDPPYGTTACKWDSVIPFEQMWEQLKRIIKPNGAIVFTASQPFTSALVMSQPKLFRYEWIWEKSIATQFLDAKRKPLKKHESVLVFAKKQTTYNPQFSSGKPYSTNPKAKPTGIYGEHVRMPAISDGKRYPTTVMPFKNERGLHPTQKPVALLEYLIRTYTNEGETVLDFTHGSGSTGVAAVNTGRKYIGIEMDGHYFNISKDRILATTQDTEEI